VIDRDERTRVATGVTPRQPRPGQARREPPPEKPPSSRAGRLGALIVALLVIAAAVAAIVLSLQPSGKVQLQTGSFSTDTQTAVQQLSTLIQNNSS
jgi:hypothetical protein